jgi:hypothetical protein
MPAIRFKENTPDLVVSTHILNIECIRLYLVYTNLELCNGKIMHNICL